MANIETHMEEKAEMKTRKGAKKEKQKKDTTNRGSPEPNIIEDKIEGEALETNASKEESHTEEKAEMKTRKVAKKENKRKTQPIGEVQNPI